MRTHFFCGEKIQPSITSIKSICVACTRAFVAAACCCSIFFAHMLVASESMVSELALNLFHVDRSNRRNRSSLFSVRFACFFTPSVSAAPSVVRASHASSRGVIHLLPDPSCNHPASWPRCGFAFDDQTPGALQFLSVGSVFFFFFLF